MSDRTDIETVCTALCDVIARAGTQGQFRTQYVNAHEALDRLVARITELEEALIRWHRDEGDCECREIHMLNLCRSCSADLNLRELAAAAAALGKDTPDE